MKRMNFARMGIPGRTVSDNHVLFSDSATFGDMNSPLNVLIDAIPHAIFIAERMQHTPEDWELVAINALHDSLTNLGSEQGKPYSKWCSPEMLEYLSANYSEAVSVWDQISYEEELVLPAGTKWWSTTLMPLKSDSGRHRVIGSCLDISNVKNAETALSTFMPICSVCKSVKSSASNSDSWIPIEDYLRGVKLTHGYCPDCFDRLYGHLKFPG